MKTIRQLHFKLSDKDFKRYGEALPYAWVSFNPVNLEEYDKEILIFYTKEDYNDKKGIISYISDELKDDIYLYHCTPKH